MNRLTPVKTLPPQNIGSKIIALKFLLSATGKGDLVSHTVSTAGSVMSKASSVFSLQTHSHYDGNVIFV